VKILSSKEYERLLAMEKRAYALERKEESETKELLERIAENKKEFEAKMSELLNEREELTSRMEDLRTKINALDAPMDENCVKVFISNDLQTIKPVISYRDDVFESLFQEGFLDDTQQGNEFSVQLALITIAAEGLGQIVESFEEPVSKEA